MRFTSMVTLVTVLTINSSASAADYVAMSGKELYTRFCASCHGTSGEGDGKVASSVEVEVPDLTLLARRAKGVYPRDLIVRVIDGRHVTAAHGTRTMPVWGEDLSRAELGNPDAERGARVIIDRLADYVWLLQKPTKETARNSTNEQ
jgi:mono/diheme cytochrome c family protein